MSSFYEFICYGCGGPSDIPVCYLCTCEQCGNILIQGTCLKCNSGTGNSFTYDPIPESFNEVQIIPNPPPQFHFNIYLCQISESNSHYGYECLQRVPLVYESEPCYNPNFSDNDYSHDLPGVNPLIDHHCCYKCGNSLNDFFCHQCTYEFCGNGAYIVGIFLKPTNANPHNIPSIIQSSMLTMTFSILKISLWSNLHPCVTWLVSKYKGRKEEEKRIEEEQAAKAQNWKLPEGRKEEEKRIEEEQAAKAQNWKLPVCYDDDDDEERSISLKDNIISGLPPCDAITPSLSTKEPDNSLSMGDEHLDTIPATESDEFIKSSVESLVPIPSESKSVPDDMCDVPFPDNSPPPDVSIDQFEDFSDSNDESTLYDDDSFSIDNIEYVEASPPNSELVSSEVMEIVIPESSSTSLNSLLEETSTFDNSLPELETFCFNLEEISSGSTTTHFDISLPKYEAFYDGHVKEISNGSTTTHSDSSLYDSFIFDLSINPFPPADRSDFYEFADELSHIISLPKYDCFCFKIEPNSGDFTMDVVEDTFSNKITKIAPQNLLSFGNEDTIFDPGIFSYHISSFMPDVSHRSGAFIKFKVLNESPMEISFSTCSSMDR
uniref:Pre-mRNA splicing Prp18-interacting factor n=1 Tax=Tanacetum cinerariifolium TaxID=118510 RepID=A0A6L2JLD0_TANCI|nr:hypothetical protein [Tanacetum cinerariifolium]